MTYASEVPGSQPTPKVKVWRVQLYDGDRVADQWLSNIKPWDLGRNRCQFNERGTGILTTVEGQFSIDRVEVDR
jgi:hypothetical protein